MKDEEQAKVAKLGIIVGAIVMLFFIYRASSCAQLEWVDMYGTPHTKVSGDK